MAFTQIVLVFSAVLGLILLSEAKGPLCSSHPLYKAGMNHQIIRSWSFETQKADGDQHWSASNYFPQYRGHSWQPVDNPKSTKYSGLDYFTTHTGKLSRDKYVTLNFQRRAKLYLIVHAWVRGYPAATLAGWNFEGWIQLTDASPRGKAVFGLGKRKQEMYAPSTGVVFSKTGVDISVPDAKYIAANIRGISAKGYWSALISEADGSAVKAPANPPGMTVPAGGRCPNALHDTWKAQATDASDEQTRNMKFATWHPLWDPCFWCGYDHEHGSAAKELMGYSPRYGYTALKNGMQLESHKGFKDMVLDVGKYRVYYGIHAHMSKARRFTTQLHTLVLAVTHKVTRELMLELRFKADYGHRAVRLAVTNKHMPLTAADQAIANANDKNYKPRKHRLVNVIDPAGRDPRWSYRVPNFMHGQYEQWATAPICSYTTRYKEPTVDFRDMGLALKSAAGAATTVLGRDIDGTFYQQPSTNRQLRGTFTLGDAFCIFALPDIAGKSTNGTFYTDPYGKKLLPEASPAAIKQFIKPGFSIDVSGVFETDETWLGLYGDGKGGRIRNVGLCVDETEN